MLAAVRQVPAVVGLVVVAQVGEEHRGLGQVLEQLHRQGAVGVGLRGADDRLVGAVPVVGIVEEGLGDVHRAEVVRQLGLGLDADEVQVPLVDEVAHGVVAADLPLERLGRQGRPVVAHLPTPRLQPSPCAGDRVLGHELAAADDLPLVDVLDVDPEHALPLGGVGRRRVHAHAATAEDAVGLAAQPAHRAGGPDVGHDALQHRGPGDVAHDPVVGVTRRVERAGGGEHRHHARVLRVDVAEEQEGARSEAGGDRREVGEGPDSEVEDRKFHAGGGQPLGLGARQLARPDNLPGDALDLAGGLQGVDQPLLEAPGDVVLALVGEATPVREGQNSYLPLGPEHLYHGLLRSRLVGRVYRPHRSRIGGNSGNGACGSAWYQYATEAMSSVSGW